MNPYSCFKFSIFPNSDGTCPWRLFLAKPLLLVFNILTRVQVDATVQFHGECAQKESLKIMKEPSSFLNGIFQLEFHLSNNSKLVSYDDESEITISLKQIIVQYSLELFLKADYTKDHYKSMLKDEYSNSKCPRSLMEKGIWPVNWFRARDLSSNHIDLQRA